MRNLQDIQDPVERAFWSGAGRGELLVRYCNRCQRPHWYPRPICPHCTHTETRFEAASGLGHIYSLTRLRAKGQPTRCIAYITLDEGVTLLSNVIEDEAQPAHIGQCVKVTFAPGVDGLQQPVFVPLHP